MPHPLKPTLQDTRSTHVHAQWFAPAGANPWAEERDKLWFNVLFKFLGNFVPLQGARGSMLSVIQARWGQTPPSHSPSTGTGSRLSLGSRWGCWQLPCHLPPGISRNAHLYQLPLPLPPPLLAFSPFTDLGATPTSHCCIPPSPAPSGCYHCWLAHLWDLPLSFAFCWSPRNWAALHWALLSPCAYSDFEACAGFAGLGIDWASCLSTRNCTKTIRSLTDARWEPELEEKWWTRESDLWERDAAYYKSPELFRSVGQKWKDCV